jgi:hypothetical protein
VDCAGLQKIEMTGLAEVAGDDPEPEFVDVNDAGEIVVTLQENNHISRDRRRWRGQRPFQRGHGGPDRDRHEEGRAAWISPGRGGRPARARCGKVDRRGSLSSWRTRATGMAGRAGSPSSSATVRSSMKVVRAWSGRWRPWVTIRTIATRREWRLESVEVATFDGVPMLFVASERASLVAVYDLTDSGRAGAEADPALGDQPRRHGGDPGAEPVCHGERGGPAGGRVAWPRRM